MILLPLLLAAAQHSDRSTDRLPPANPLSMGEDAPAAVLAPLQALLSTADPARIAALTEADGGATIVTQDGPDPSAAPTLRQIPWSAFRGAADPADQLTDPAVEVDADVATVWSPYLARSGTRIAGCGIIQASLIRGPAGWRVLTMVRSVRHAGCEQLTAGAVRP